MNTVTCLVMTAPTPGAVGLIQLHGNGAAGIIEQLTGKRPDRRCRLADLGGIDEGLIVSLHDGWCQVMPHGGLRVMAKLIERMAELGATRSDSFDARQLYPEAGSDLEADMLLAMARAASPAAIDLLADQPRRWRTVHTGELDWPNMTATAPLDRLLHPPAVCLVGKPNVGKSTLTNLVVGRAASLTADLPGTTRDWVGGIAELPTAFGELAVQWIDTPGIHHSNDPIEQRAIELAREAIDQADLLIALRDPAPGNGWPDDLPERPTLRVWNKADLAMPDESCLAISALAGEGLDELGTAIAGALSLDVNRLTGPWPFSANLREITAHRDGKLLAAYINAV